MTKKEKSQWQTVSFTLGGIVFSIISGFLLHPSAGFAIMAIWFLLFAWAEHEWRKKEEKQDSTDSSQ